ncbi:C39 family peptidase [Enterococcus sp. AZ103]|uniref:C39 family peptidase n=1 Tax=Enterococcus sp. AZ103 TaxID=2774628 RepID=UPI003F20917B
MRRKSRFPKFLFLLLLLGGGYFGYRYFIESSQPVDADFVSEANQKLQTDGQKMPLILQTDPTWANTPYGSGSTTNDLATNGCAIASLAMVASFYQSRNVSPQEILNWSGNTYYTEGSGTAWSIFSAFAANNGLNYQNLGVDGSAIQNALNRNIPVVLSVNPGEFTDVGHIMVIMKDLNTDQIRVFDPNDSPRKKHYNQTYNLIDILNQTSNAWAFS